jgi:site-specific DNA-methyltransferase (adenine-specific)
MNSALKINSTFQGDANEFMAGLPEEIIQLILADPPYFGVKDIKEIEKQKKKLLKNISDDTVDWDCQWETMDDYIDWMIIWIKNAERILKKDGAICIFHNQILTIAYLIVAIDKHTNLHLLNDIVWNKRFNIPSHLPCKVPVHMRKKSKRKGFLNGFVVLKNKKKLENMKENVLIYVKDEKDHKFNSLGTHHSVWDYDFVNKKDIGTIHVTPKPIGLLIELLKHFSDLGDLIYDPFMGSGATAEACKRSRRLFYGSEQDSDYHEHIKNTVEAQTKLFDFLK